MLANAPKLVPLRYGTPYCDECRDTLRPGMLVAWWRVLTRGGTYRKAVLCAACHRGRLAMRRGRR